MKKTLMISALLLTSGLAMANPQNFSGGFNGPMAQASTTVAQALEARDASMVQLTGHITHIVGEEEYQFSDGKHQIVVEIDDEQWMGLNVTPKDKVTIVGEVEKDWSEVKVEVSRIQAAG
ncbi:NirD/YgiW/YdeI family stress tolerance protein [Vibrio parahaemolyticus]|uniref:YgiW/YdeI family stress tolerance OB fold protein n=1 Tax=Vibrio parahaemolyticus TaxID=670 RepID=UPI00146A6047|nr:NirD/YgiW/YdeI family stress tolerance protein [Vibrio parahaemolyticus]MDF5022312.1 NirD/YgiW/YdeI family stress tolerance protein [Vibrio parahaemolyticus]MDF5041612.1 NirD/YgiW/YdeI family stress tolerance protein [Vibrio parahaemolyticus]MDF5157764.1 NirD/YgiW/YdeI family stress tolerance protein [Vibrio parahaemolyticus]MDF5161842.1 NirD/YgiW/YdeI family stress tolerance protein [Vibrio parahaemolyticus]MDF5171405.1 NirD/YgiW/YdeI family stress tolerance protein [Vibrio parahaemolyticu